MGRGVTGHARPGQGVCRECQVTHHECQVTHHECQVHRVQHPLVIAATLSQVGLRLV